MIHKQITIKYEKIISEINKINLQLKTFPKERLLCNNNGPYIQWHTTDGHNIKYLSKKERTLAEQLAYKEYLICKLQDLEKERTALDFYLRHHSNTTSKVEHLLSDTNYQELLTPHFTPQDQSLSEWMNSSYEKNHQYPEQLIIKTENNTYVRSKSEAMIHMFLSVHQIPFRYECALTLGNITLYPDFTIRHPSTGETYYWEHFGLMDEPKYSQNAFSKQQLYASHGIIPTLQLITTYETAENPLNPDIIEKTIIHYFKA
ncbi:MAG: ATPase [Lachnospiraceae bacterium]|nr:ATPase [Lachnospiraceae bacterium]